MLFRTVAALICLPLLLTACPSKKSAGPPQRPPAPVLVATSSQRDVPVVMRAIGTMEASESVTIKTQISGELTRIAFKEGQFVLVVKPDATAELRPVSAGAASRGVTVIEKGLALGEQVVIDGHVRVVPGAKVEIRQPEKPGAAKQAAPVATK